VSDLSFKDVLRKIALCKEMGVQMVLFSGGEPTIRRDLLKICKACKAMGLAFGLITNGRMLSYEGYRKALLDAGMEYVHTSLHGANAQTHNAIVQSQSFDDVLMALDGLKGQCELHVNTVIVRHNIGQLFECTRLLSRFAPLTHKLCLAEPKGLFLKNRDDLMVSPSQAANEAIRTVEKSREMGMTVRVEIEGFPLCQVPEGFQSGLKRHNIQFMSEVFEEGFYETDWGDRVYQTVCNECSAKPKCPGIYKGYADLLGDKGLAPIP
jgi:molybdenum cofactor biosynthesis enzyme MoaA